MASVNSGVEARRGLVMLLTEFRLIPGSFEMRKKKSDVIIVEETGEWSGMLGRGFRGSRFLV